MRAYTLFLRRSNLILAHDSGPKEEEALGGRHDCGRFATSSDERVSDVFSFELSSGASVEPNAPVLEAFRSCKRKKAER